MKKIYVSVKMYFDILHINFSYKGFGPLLPALLETFATLHLLRLDVDFVYLVVVNKAHLS